MPAITRPAKREIVEDFAAEIRERRLETVRPSTTVINFRNDRADGVERTVWRVPIQILRYRKDNGRIASDVLDYETNVGVLDETDEEAQQMIRHFLERKDPEKTAVLTKSIMHAGQTEPAIVTCDGFLINGNRRKMVMEALREDFPDDGNFAYMKAVILPGPGDPGGAPTLLEIEKLENRYQLQSSGKSEYYGFDRALSIKRKMALGLSLEEQLRDDPQFAKATRAEIERAVKECERESLQPLECVDRYLRQFHREGQYGTISRGMSDPEGRWQAFKDYSNIYNTVFSNDKRRIQLGIEEEEIGDIEEAAFDIIRLRNIPDLPKVHMIMRALPKYCRTRDGKKEIMKIAKDVDPVLPNNECIDSEEKPLDSAAVDVKWAAKNRQSIIFHTVRAASSHEILKEKETPIELLEAALKKLTHDDMDLEHIAIGDYKKAMKLACRIKETANELESKIYHLEKQLAKLEKKKKQ